MYGYDGRGDVYGMDGGFIFFGGGLFGLLIVILFLWFYGRIFSRAGFSGWWALLALVPVVNLVMLWVFAFIDWPSIDREPETDI